MATNNFYIDKGDFISLFSKGNEIIIDKEDFDKVSKYTWCISKTGYAVANINGKVTKLHRYILDLKNSNQIVDHINRDKLDNRKNNLRFCSQKENSRNCSLSKNNTSGHVGIDKTKFGKYRARITVNRQEIRLGNYDTIEEAIDKRKQAELLYFGEFAPSRC